MSDGSVPESPSLGLDLQLNPKEQFDELLNKRAILEENLSALERQIYAFEGNYLEDTQACGNVVIGFDNYLTSTHASGSGGGGRGRQASAAAGRKQRIKESHRIFSNSSSTYMKALGIKEDVAGTTSSSAHHIDADMEGGDSTTTKTTTWRRGRKKMKQRHRVPRTMVTDMGDKFDGSAHTATIEPAGPRKLRLKLTPNSHAVAR